MYFHCSKFCTVVKLIGRVTSITSVIQQGDRRGAVSAGPSWGHGKATRAHSACARQYAVLLQASFKGKTSRCSFQNQLAKNHCQGDGVCRSLSQDMHGLNIQKKWY